MCIRDRAGHLKAAARRFEEAGAEVREVRLPCSWEEIQAVRSLICEVEMADVHAPLLRDHPEGYAPLIRGLVEIGQLLPDLHQSPNQRGVALRVISQQWSVDVGHLHLADQAAHRLDLLPGAG